MTSWKTYRLGDIASFSQGIQVDIDKQLPYKKGGYVRFIRIVDFTKANEPYRYIETPKKQYLTNSGDIVMIRYGSQTAGLVVKSFEGAIANNMFKITLDEQVVDRDFIYYALSQEDIFSSLRNAQSSSTMPAITFEIASRIQLKIPPLEEQRRIAGILGAIDDKIENNRRINTNLELQAQALFDKWCESCAKNITIKELADNILDYTPNANSEVVLLNSSDVTQGVFAKLPLVSNVNLKGQFKKRFQKGDILYSEIRPRNKHYAYCYFDSDRYIASTRLIVLRGKKEKIVSNTILYQYLISQNVFEEFTLKTETRSGTFPQGNYQDLSSIVVPYSDNQREIAGVLDSIYKRIWHNNTEIETLATLRDTLLPKLMNGEIITK